MEIISHRGFWNEKIEKNSMKAFRNSFEKNFGTETDIRDFEGKLIISHDVPNPNFRYITFDDFLFEYVKYSNKLTLALNVKSDGLQQMIKDKLLKYKIKNYFLFDMSIPDQINYIKNNLSTYLRLSEFEQMPKIIEHYSGFWLDAFNYLWYDADFIMKLINTEKKICIVSFELHKRDHQELWSMLKENNIHKLPQVILCTDYPIKAKLFFNEN